MHIAPSKCNPEAHVPPWLDPVKDAGGTLNKAVAWISEDRANDEGLTEIVPLPEVLTIFDWNQDVKNYLSQ